MQTRHFTLGIALLMLTGAVGAAEARTRHVQCKGAGTFVDGVETHIDTNGDGQSASVDQGLQNCNIGRLFFQEELEWIPRPVTSACPAGTTEELFIDPTHGQQRGVSTNEKTGDQLFGKVTSATLCLNGSAFPFPFTVSGQGEAIGGTGKYTGATGTDEFHSAGSFLIFGVKDGIFGGFGQFNFTSDGTLILPDDHKD
jgi:hypothetical protein